MLIYNNTRAWRVRIAQAAIWIGGGVIVWLAFFSDSRVESYGEQVFVWVMAALSIIVMAGTEFYLRAYVLQLRAEGAKLAIETLSFFGQRSLSVDLNAITFGRERHDFSNARGIVSNYWIPLNVPGEVLPLIVDTTATDIDIDALAKAWRRAGRVAGG